MKQRDFCFFFVLMGCGFFVGGVFGFVGVFFCLGVFVSPPHRVVLFDFSLRDSV